MRFVNIIRKSWTLVLVAAFVASGAGPARAQTRMFVVQNLAGIQLRVNGFPGAEITRKEFDGIARVELRPELILEYRVLRHDLHDFCAVVDQWSITAQK